MRRNKKRRHHYYGEQRRGVRQLKDCLAEHAPPGYKCLVNSPWSEADTARQAMCCGYDDFQTVKGHYDLVEGEAIFDGGVGCMLFVPKETLGDEMVDYE